MHFKTAMHFETTIQFDNQDEAEVWQNLVKAVYRSGRSKDMTSLEIVDEADYMLKQYRERMKKVKDRKNEGGPYRTP